MCFRKCHNWFHVKFEWWKNYVFPTLCRLIGNVLNFHTVFCTGAFLRGPTPPQGAAAAAAAAAGLRLVHPAAGQQLVVNNGLAIGGVHPPGNTLGAFGAPHTSTANVINSGSTGAASRRESMDKAFSPSILEQYKNKGWPSFTGKSS